MLLPGLAAKGYGKRVEVTARLEEDTEDPEAYYCLDEIWDWGDGTESVHENDCDPYEEDKEILRNFTDTHHYRPGEYAITLRLVRRDRTVVKGVIDVGSIDVRVRIVNLSPLDPVLSDGGTWVRPAP
jgi:hypothetical protein